MDIAQLSTVLAQNEIQQTASIGVLKMSMDTASHQGDALAKLMSTAQTISDPSLGQSVNLLA